jgi:signal transduction histidine kinase
VSPNRHDLHFRALTLLGVLPALFLCFLFTNSAAQNIHTIDSLRRQMGGASEAKQFELLNAMGFEFRFSFPDSTIYYCNKAYVLGQRIQLHKGMARPLSFIGLARANQGNYKMALEFYNRSLAVAAEQSDTLQLAHGHNNVGRIFHEKGDLVRAYNEFVLARDLFESINDRSGLAYVYRSLADLFKAKGDYQKALENSKKALDLRKSLGGQRAITSAYMELGLVYQQVDSTPLALRQFELADSIASIMADRITKAEIMVGMAEILCKEGRSSESAPLAEEVLQAVTENTNQRVFLRARLVLARCSIHLGKYPLAATVLEKVYRSSETSGNVVFQRDAAQLLGKVNLRLNKPDQAQEYETIAQLLQGKIENEDLNKEIERLQFQLLTEKTEKENELLKAQQVKDEAVIAEQRFQNLMLLTIMIFGTILAVSVWTVSRKRKAINQQLEEQNQHIRAQREEIIKQNEVLSNSNRELDSLNHEKDTLMNIVAHDLKAPLNRISGLAHILERDGELSSQQKELLRLVKDCTRGGIDLISGLLDVHAFNDERETPKPSAISFDEFIKQKAQPYHALGEAKGIKIHGVNRIQDRVLCDASYLGRIIDNLISNAVKFSPRNSIVEVSTEWKSGCIYLSVKDQGPGFSQQDLGHLYEKFRRLSAQPTGGESSHGLGLAIVKTLVDRLGGSIELETSPKGSEFLVRIPAEQL